MQHLALSDRHIAEAEQRIVEQEHRLAKLRAGEHDVGEAERLLANMRDTLREMRVHRQIILDAIAGR